MDFLCETVLFFVKNVCYWLYFYYFQYFKGVDEAVLRNIDACVQLSSQIRSAYGPNGSFFLIFSFFFC